MELGGLFNQSTYKGTMVTMHFGSHPDGVCDNILLDLSVH